MAEDHPELQGNYLPDQADELIPESQPYPDIWVGDGSLSDFRHHSLGPQYDLDLAGDNYTWSNPPSESFSMELSSESGAMSSSSLHLSSLPQLTDSPSTITGRDSVITMDQDASLNQYLLDEGESGAFEVPNVFNCQFGFLACYQRFRSLEQWDTHCKWHCPPDRKQRCPFESCMWSTEADDGEAAWSDRWHHIYTDHQDGSRVDYLKKPDLRLINHMHRQGKIDVTEKKELQRCGHLRNCGPFIMTADRRRDERQGYGTRNPRRM